MQKFITRWRYVGLALMVWFFLCAEYVNPASPWLYYWALIGVSALAVCEIVGHAIQHKRDRQW